MFSYSTVLAQIPILPMPSPTSPKQIIANKINDEK